MAFLLLVPAALIVFGVVLYPAGRALVISFYDVDSPFLALNMVVLADVWKNTSLVAFFLLAGLQTIPRELYEAARVDGAGPVRSFFRITLPLLTPTVAIVLVLRTIDAFRVFDIIYVMTRGGPASGTRTITFLTYELGGAMNCGKAQPGQVAAVSHGAPTSLFRGIRILNTNEEGTA